MRVNRANVESRKTGVVSAEHPALLVTSWDGVPVEAIALLPEAEDAGGTESRLCSSGVFLLGKSRPPI